ncbi:MAG: type II toxin-antitoxin system PrlF family antitoxin [Sphaerospermopsis sp.]|uniref:HtaR suppressor protein homolog n=1 Tax=Sphaerospermopsis reniformis TaxID=531300 RepID=A0A480A4U4_9CYAN|nr:MULTISPECIES: type II toxin-antitoxin system PrlF family antitoxin [Sphaerospermopsis]MBD2136004.1 type II toxin-antitoxin system PrlF family antitoxin [Sphaerospermopsis sp. FACHB-1094]MEB3149006.1 type II toxin-antitoxin system PrlF family antitoxin [Sphaerospermopsis sp.]GCL38448.1 HtaR suppressor protein homolog [Sphaerospermopsis reniformis]
MVVKPTPSSESTLTDRYQTTIPEPVRKALGLGKRDKIRYVIQPDGKVIISRVDQKEEDPTLGEFLNFIAQDIQKNPQHLQLIKPELVTRIQSLVADVEIDLDTPLSDEDE